VFIGGGAWAAWQSDHNAAGWWPGLIGLLVVVAAVTLTVTGRYPRQMFDLLLGLNRWVLRVAAYAALMTDQYPPFRLDMGGLEGHATVSGAPPEGPQPTWPSDDSLASQPPPPAAAPSRSGWTGLRVVSVVVGCIIGVLSVGLLAAGGAATWLDNSQRDSAGYLTSGTHSFATPGYAITSDRVDLGSSEVVAPAGVLGTVRFHVTAHDPARAVFVGIAPGALADTYLAGVSRSVVTNWVNGTAHYRYQAGGPPPSAPTSSSIWVASVHGKGTQTLTWKPTSGDWRVVVMNPDASPGVVVTADAGATIPALGWITGGLFAVGGVLLVAGATLILVPVMRASRRPVTTYTRSR
jgi:hypothetical protein